MDREAVPGGGGFLERVNQVGWIGNYALSFAMIGIGVAFGWWGIVAGGLVAGIPGGLVTHIAIVRRWPSLLARSQGMRLGVSAAALVLAVMLVALGGWLGGVWAAVSLGVLVVIAEFLVAREWVARGVERRKVVNVRSSS